MPEKVTKAESGVAEEAKEQYRSAADINMEWLQRAREGYRFALGISQWDAEVLGILAKEGRPALTINLILPIINLLSGYQRQNRSDIKLYPRHGGAQPIAALGTELMKHAMDTCEGEFELSDSFYDGIVCGKGWLSADRTFNNDPLHGDIVVQKESPFDIVADQYNKRYNINAGMFVFKGYWWNKRQIELAYPGKVSSIEQATEAPEWEFEKFYDPSAGDDYPEDPTVVLDRDEGRQKVQYYIKERWYKRWENCTFLIHTPTLTVQRLDKKHIEKANYIVQIGAGEYRVIERVIPVLYRSVHAGDMVLEHIKDPFDGLALFPFFRFCPYWVDGYVMGVVDNLKGPQEEVNKRRSQVLHNLNTSANSGWKIKKARNPEALKNLKKFGSKPGVVLQEDDFGGVLERIEPSKLDTGHFTLAQQSAADIQSISGINPALLEQAPEARESGKAKMLRQHAGLTVSEVIFDNFNRTQRQMGEFLWEIIRRSDVYSEEEVKAVVQEASLKPFMRDDGGIDLSAIRSWHLGRYGVKVSRSPNVPTIRMANYEQLLAAIQAGLPIPPEFLIELSDLPNKDEILQYVRNMAQQLPAGAAQ